MSGMTMEQARTGIPKLSLAERNSQSQHLMLQDTVMVKGKPMTVAELLENGKQFDGVSMPDPIEGPEYGTTTAKFYVNEGKRPLISSLAHGIVTTYHLEEPLEFDTLKAGEALPENPPIGNGSGQSRFFKVSSSVGSGKTTLVLKLIADNSALANYIFAAPTLKVIAEVKEKMLSLGVSPEVITTEQEPEVAPAAIKCINSVEDRDGSVVILTTTTFLRIVTRMKNKRLWNVFLDEGFNPFSYVSFSSTPHAYIFKETLKLTKQEKFTVATFKPEYSAQARQIVDKRQTEDQLFLHPTYIQVCEDILDPCKVVDYIETAKNPDGNLNLVSHVSPERFKGFDSLVFMAALFEMTPLYHLWKTVYGIQWEDFDEISNHPDLFDTHTEKGPLMSFHYILHEENNASKYVLESNVTTGQPNERDRDQRVLSDCIILLNFFFIDDEFLLQTNNHHLTEKEKIDVENAMHIPAYAHGLNQYQAVDNVAVLAATNPHPLIRDWMVNHLGLSKNAANECFRLHTMYQGIGRCSLRDRDNHNAKKVVVLDRSSAIQFHRIFQQSTLAGKIGAIPRIRMENTVPAYKVTALLALEILKKYDLAKVSSMKLKQLVIDRHGGEIAPQTWKRAFRYLCGIIADYDRAGNSLVKKVPISLQKS